MVPPPGRPLICDGCGAEAWDIHEIEYREVRDLPILDGRTWLLVPRRRLACPRRGPKLERLSWPDRHARVTKRLAESVARLCAVLPIKHVAEFFRRGWDAVKAIDKRYLTRNSPPAGCPISSRRRQETQAPLPSTDS